MKTAIKEVFVPKVVIALLVVFTGIVFATSAKAEDLSFDLSHVMLNLGSKHSEESWCFGGECAEFNEQNFGMAAVFEITQKAEAHFGFFDNSYNQTSLYAGVNFKRRLSLINNIISVDPGVMLGLSTGYQNTPSSGYGGIVPIVLPNASINFFKKYRVMVGYIPKMSSEASSVVTMQAGWEFY